MKVQRAPRSAPPRTAAAASAGPKKPASAKPIDTFEPGKPGKVIHSNARVVRGTAGDDIIYGGSRSQRIDGGGGNDLIIGGGGGDRINGGDGRDRLVGGAGGDTLHGGKGNDRLAGGRGNDDLYGDDDHDRLAGEIGDDHLYGGRGNDRASGGMGIDVLKGGEGDDVQSGDAGPDFIDGGHGDDTVSFATQTGPGWDRENPNSGVRVEANKPSQWRSTYEGVHYPGSAYGGSRSAGGGGVDGLKSNENVIGSAKDDQVNGDFKHVDLGPEGSSGGVQFFHGTLTVNGTAGNDRIKVRQEGSQVVVTNNGQVTRLKGRVENVQLEGGDGNDRLSVAGLKPGIAATLSGGNGNDTLVGGRGNDVLNDGAGDDVLEGGGGDDGLTNSAGRDTLHGGAGNDLLVSSSIDSGDLLDGGAGLDNVSFAQAGHDFAVRAKIGGFAQRTTGGPQARITGSAEDLEGTEGDDELIGDGRDNHLLGRGGADTLRGLGGDDLLEAKYQDADKRLDGGKGTDRALLDPEDRRAVRNVER